jgi:hypothetical protein
LTDFNYRQKDYSLTSLTHWHRRYDRQKMPMGFRGLRLALFRRARRVVGRHPSRQQAGDDRVRHGCHTTARDAS